MLPAGNEFERMKIAIVHYHLRPGGVTRVITNALQALEDSQIQCCVLTGEVHDSFSYPHLVRQVDALGYSDRPLEDPQETITRLRIAAEAVLGGPPDLWHIHNHSLGKNPTYHKVTAELARQGERLLLQIHDFAEDGRPGNYQLLRLAGADLNESLYPLGSHVHYGLLNGRDYELLRAAGADEAFLHSLPNSVQLEFLEDGRSCEEGLILYPSREFAGRMWGRFFYGRRRLLERRGWPLPWRRRIRWHEKATRHGPSCRTT